MNTQPHIPLDFGYKSPDGYTYSDLLIDRELKTVYLIMNASCSAAIASFVAEVYGLSPSERVKRFLVVFNGKTRHIDMERLPKKYHKFNIVFS